MNRAEIIRSLDRVEDLLAPIRAGALTEADLVHRVNNARQIIQAVKLELQEEAGP